MSQNSYTLLIFASTSESNPLLAQQLADLARTERPLPDDDANSRLQPEDDQAETVFKHCFNIEVEQAGTGIALHFDKSSGADMPLYELQWLFKHGARVVCVEASSSQTGDMEQGFYVDGSQFDHTRIFKRFPAIAHQVERFFEDPDEAESCLEYNIRPHISEPIPLEQLIEKAEQEYREGAEMADEFSSLLAGKSPKEMNEVLKLLLTAAKAEEGSGESVFGIIRKGIFHALLFGITTSLLFNGLWFWILLTLVLLVLLPFLYVNKAVMDFDEQLQQPEVDEEVSHAH